MEIDASKLDQQSDFVGPSLTLIAECEFNQIDRKSIQNVLTPLYFTEKPYNLIYSIFFLFKFFFIF